MDLDVTNTTTLASMLSVSTVVVLLFATFVFLIRKKKPNCKLLSTAPLPPGPSPWPILGNVPDMMLNKPAFRWIHLLMKEMDSDIACIRLGNIHVIPITCPKIALEVLKEKDAIFASRPLTFASKTFSGGYKDCALSPFGDQSNKMRRVLKSEIICPARHKWLLDKRTEEADNLLRYMYNLSRSSTTVDVRKIARHFCGNVTRRLLFNKRYFGEPMPDGGPGLLEVEHVDAIFTTLGHLYAFCISDYLPWLLGLDLDGHEKVVKEANKVLNRLHETVIDERIAKWKSGEKQELEDFLDVLITLEDKEGKPLLTTQEVKAQVQDITIAAVDNPSNAVEWALAEMVNNSEILQNAIEELDRVVGRDRLVQESDIPQLNYLKACIRESFRLHPVAPFNLPHVALCDTTVAGYFIPKGSHVILSRMGLGRNGRIWDEPLKYKPERHMTDPNAQVVLTENELRFISFSTGRRGCIAASLGTAMSIMLFGRLLQGFTWSKPQGASIGLAESKLDTSLAQPLVLHVEPRLPLNLYPGI